MGNSESSDSDTHFVSASRSFTQQELGDLRSLFVSLAAQSLSNLQYITQPVFQAYFGVHGALGERMFYLVSQQRNQLTYQDLVIAKATYEKGTRDDIDAFVYQLLDVNGDGFVNRSDIEAVIISTYESIFSSGHVKNGSYLDLVEPLLNAATFSSDVQGTGSTMSYNDFRNWCNVLPFLRKFLCGLLTASSARSISQVPHLLYPKDVGSQLIMREEYAWQIGGALSVQELGDWKLLYHSATNGLSFNTFLGNVSFADGPTIVLIKDKAGFIFGGYASQPWERHNEFYGDMKSFVFMLHPRVSIFRPSGLNANLQWCAVNFTSENIPNGIGFGGQVNHFGLFLSGNFDVGHSFQCNTFSSPCLSKENQIVPEVIECWGVAARELQQQRKPESAKGSVLQRFKEDRHMLNMVGLANSSESA